MIDLTGQHIFIAGGSRGIGAAAARMAAKAGADVTINDMSRRDAADKVIAEIEATGRRGDAVQGAVSYTNLTRATKREE